MAEPQAPEVAESRPKASHTSRSFSRMDDPPNSPLTRSRTNTLQESGIPNTTEVKHISPSPEPIGRTPATDIFEHGEEDEPALTNSQMAWPGTRPPTGLEELPVEIKSLTERFLESLSAKVHPTPLNIETISEMFQDFYERAGPHIATHVASLSTRMARERSPVGSTSMRNALRSGSWAGLGTVGSSDSLSSFSGGEMLTASEVADRKKARRLLELRRTALEEAVERVVCEKVYDKIWKHRSSDDDARDEKLRSRTASLALVGIGLKELHMDADPTKEHVRKTAAEKEDEIYRSLATARESLQNMDLERYPLGKLQHLTAAHKSIVETLSQLFPSSSSADEILPTLIYTLITSPPEGINVVSNLNFIQRFRASAKVDGEAAYCLVNLEAAISFLETVDLSSLRQDELPEGPSKPDSRPLTPRSHAVSDPLRPSATRTLTPGISTVTVQSSDKGDQPISATKDGALSDAIDAGSRPLHSRRLSNLVQAQAGRIEASRDNLLNAADKIYESINGTLDNSLQFVFGRFKEHVAMGDSPLPKTLEDARKLVNSPPAIDDESNVSTGGRNSPAIEDPLGAGGSRPDNKMLDIFVGRKDPRDRSVDSARSGGSNRRVAFATASEKVKDESSSAASAASAGNLFASMNPLNRFGMPVSFPRFGRGGGVPNSGSTEKQTWTGDAVVSNDGGGVGNEKLRTGDATSGLEELNAREALAELRKIKPPRRRFLEVPSADHLKIGEIEDLLVEYRRLAKAIGEAIAM